MQNSENESKSFPMKRIIMLFFLFGIVLTLTAQNKINLDTLDIDQLNVYKDKAVKLRNAGMILTLSGVGIVAAGFITSVIWMETSSLGGFDVIQTLIPFELGILVGIPTIIVGIPLWAVGGSRNAKAELALKKFNIVPENSMAVGLGITLRF